MKLGWAGLILIVCAFAVPANSSGSERNPIPDGVEMIIWEHQNWETNGGFERLTIWSDGRSEVMVVPLRYARDGQENLRPKEGWEKVSGQTPSQVAFVRRNLYPPDVARAKLRGALAAGLHLLESFKPGYVDGDGTRVVIQINGEQKEAIVPMFRDSEKGTLNHQRYLAVSELLGGFDKSAFEVMPK